MDQKPPFGGFVVNWKALSSSATRALDGGFKILALVIFSLYWAPSAHSTARAALTSSRPDHPPFPAFSEDAALPQDRRGCLRTAAKWLRQGPGTWSLPASVHLASGCILGKQGENWEEGAQEVLWRGAIPPPLHCLLISKSCSVPCGVTV